MITFPIFDPPSPDSDRDRGGGALVLRAGYAAGWPPEILGRVGRKTQKYKFCRNAEHPPIGKLNSETNTYWINLIIYIRNADYGKLHWLRKRVREHLRFLKINWGVKFQFKQISLCQSWHQYFQTKIQFVFTDHICIRKFNTSWQN